MPSVKIGEDEISLQEWSSFKALRAMRLVKEVLVAYPGLLGEMQTFTTTYQRENVTVLDRATALFELGPERLAHLTDEDWIQSGNHLTLPRSPSLEEQMLAVFPSAFDQAEAQTLRLCALALLTNRELENADDEGGNPAVDQLIADRAKRLVHESKTDQLLELLVVSLEMAQDQVGTKLDDLKDRLGNALRLFGLRLPKGQTPAADAEATAEEMPSTDPASAEEASPTKPPSSSSSPASSDGTEPPASTAPAGTSPSSSALA